MKRRQGWLFFIIFLLTLSVYLLINYPLQLGLDLQGGSQLTLQIIKEEGKVTRDELEAVNSVIDKRVNNLGVSESNFTNPRWRSIDFRVTRGTKSISCFKDIR